MDMLPPASGAAAQVFEMSTTPAYMPEQHAPLAKSAAPSEWYAPPPAPNPVPEPQSDSRRLEKRKQQIDEFKEKIGYRNYIKCVPREKRRDTHGEPDTPNPYDPDCSTRKWAGLLNAWRRQVHQWDHVDAVGEVLPAPVPGAPLQSPEVEAVQERARAKSRQVAKYWSVMCRHSSLIDSHKAIKAQIEEEIVKLDAEMASKRKRLAELEGSVDPTGDGEPAGEKRRKLDMQ
jgi:hypothetical protein